MGGTRTRTDAPIIGLAADRAWEVPVGPPGRPGHGRIGCRQDRFLKRQESLPVSMISQWCVRRSRSAVRIEELRSRIKIALPSAYPYRKALIAMAGSIAAQGP